MSLKQRLDEDLKKAMKARDEVALSAVRLLKAEVVKREIETGKDADDAEVVRLCEKQLKQRAESEGLYLKGNRPELAERERKEAAVLATYLPARLSDSELEALVADAVREAGAKSVKEMGVAMKIAQAKAAGRADGKKLAELVKKKLSTPA